MVGNATPPHTHTITSLEVKPVFLRQANLFGRYRNPAGLSPHKHPSMNCNQICARFLENTKVSY